MDQGQHGESFTLPKLTKVNRSKIAKQKETKDKDVKMKKTKEDLDEQKGKGYIQEETRNIIK